MFPSLPRWQWVVAPNAKGASQAHRSRGRMDSGARASMSDDEDGLLAELEAASLNSARLRLKLGTKKQPETIRTENVFGTPRRSEVLRSNSQVDSMLRERKRRMEAEKGLAELRKQVEAQRTSDIEEVIECFPVANAEVEEVDEVSEPPRKESNLIRAKFVALPNWPRFPDVSSEPEQDDHPLIKYMRNVGLPDADFAPCLRLVVNNAREAGPAPACFIRMLFWRLVYDSSRLCPSTCERSVELETLLDCIGDFSVQGSSCAENSGIPGMVDVLPKFGWISNESDTGKRGRTAEEIYPECLDGQVLHCETEFGKELMKAVRNLSRAFLIWFQMVKSNLPLQQVYGDSAQTMDPSGNPDHTVLIVKLCVEVLLCPFGSWVGKSSRELIFALFERIPEECWNSMKRRLVEEIMGTASEFESQERLASYFLCSYSQSSRALSFALDFSAALLKVLYSESVSILRVTRSEWPETESEQSLSFNFGDVLTLVEKSTAISKQTNVKSFSLWALLVKDWFLMHKTLLDTIQGDECMRFQKAMKHLKRCSHRLSFGIDSKNFTLAIDSMQIVLPCFVKDYAPHVELLKGGLGLGATPRWSPGAFGQPRKRQRRVTDFFSKSPS